MDAIVRSKDGRSWHLREVRCPLCNSSRSRVSRVKNGTFIREPFRIVSCCECELRYVNPRIVTEEIPFLYDDAYYRGDGFDSSVRYDSVDLSSRWEYEFAFASLENVLGSVRNRDILDVGCGSGPLLQLLKENGANAIGIDSSVSAVTLGVAKGLDVRHLHLSEVGTGIGPFDAVVMMEVIEHLTDPVDSLRRAAALLKSGGFLFVTTGNWSFVSIRRGTPYIMPEGHLSYFTPVTLAEAFRRAGLQVVDAPKNHTWIGYRLAKRFFIPTVLATLMANIIHRVAPRLGPFPFGRRP